MSKKDKKYKSNNRKVEPRMTESGQENKVRSADIKHTETDDHKILGNVIKNDKPKSDTNYKNNNEVVMNKLKEMDGILDDLQNQIGQGEFDTSLYKFVADFRNDFEHLRRVNIYQNGKKREYFLSEAIEKIYRNVEKLQRDLGTDLGQCDGPRKSILEAISEILRGVRNTLKVLDDTTGSKNERLATLNSITNVRNDISETKNKVLDSTQEIKGKLSEVLKFTEEDFQTNMQSTFKPIKSQIELLAGKTVGVDEALSDIKQALQDKNLMFRQKFPAANTDDAVLADLEEYGHTIISQLAIAARCYARSQSEIVQLEEIRKQADAEYDKGYKDGIAKGIQKGRQKAIETLLCKFNDYAVLLGDVEIGDKSARLQVLSDYLINEGIKREFEIGEVLTIDEQNQEEFVSLIQNPSFGQIRIKKNAYSFNGKILQKAEWEALEEDIVSSVTGPCTENQKTVYSQQNEFKPQGIIQDEEKLNEQTIVSQERPLGDKEKDGM